MGNIYTNYFDGSPISDGWAEHRARGSAGGVDYAVGMGTPIKAPTDGTVTNIAYNGSGGHTVNLVSPNGYKTQFMHCSRFVGEGNYSQGDVIGYTGGRGDGAGSSTGPHCHVHIVTPGGSRVNMLDYVGQDFSGNSSSGTVSDSNGANNEAAQIQQIFKDKGLYSGVVDGVFGHLSWTATQQWLANYGLYGGPVDGIPGPNTYKGFQNYGKKNNNYGGPVDGILGPRSWAGFLQTLKEDTTPAPQPVQKENTMNEETIIEAQPEQTYTPYTPEQIAAMPGAPAIVESPVSQSEALNFSSAVVVPEAPVVASETPSEAVKEVFVPVDVPASAVNAANNIGVIISTAKGRKVAYGIYVAISFLVTNTVVAYSTLEAPIPAWLKIALAIIGNSAVAFGGLAIANADNGSK